jgi:hypothetical protein
MRRNLFWLSDEQWQKIEPFLLTDVRGKERFTLPPRMHTGCAAESTR